MSVGLTTQVGLAKKRDDAEWVVDWVLCRMFAHVEDHLEASENRVVE